MKKIFLIIFVLMLSIQKNSLAQKSMPIAHDPVMAKHGGIYYLFCTGDGITVMSSNDMKDWQIERPVFETPPKWAVDAVPSYKGHTWAPDIIYHNGKYHLFYSVSSFGKNRSCIGRAENATLNPDSPDYKWIDCGKIIESIPDRDDWNAIDPNIIIDDSGVIWMSFGSFWSGIKMVRLKNDLSAVEQPENILSLASRRTQMLASGQEDNGNGAIEAPFIFKKGHYYYMFVSVDFCCRGVESTYKVVVGRSKDIKGEYVDKNGVSMNVSGGTIVVEGNTGWAGVGHNSTYSFDGVDYLVFHGYDVKRDGLPVLIIRTIKWDDEGWPTVDL